MNYDILYMIGEIPLSVIILLVGISMWRCPPKMNENFGYRTKKALRNEQTFSAAQTLYGKYSTITFSAMLAAVAAADIALLFAKVGENARFAAFMIIMAVQIVALAVDIALVEHKLKTLFDENGNPTKEQ